LRKAAAASERVKARKGSALVIGRPRPQHGAASSDCE
jgi:hypothetical protein